MDSAKRRKEAFVTESVSCIEFGERYLHQLVQKRRGSRRRSLLQRFGGNGYGDVELGSLRGKLGDSSLLRTPTTKSDQGQKQLAGNLRRPLYELGPTRTRFKLVGRKELCYLRHCG
jgi:hypothetical protein